MESCKIISDIKITDVRCEKGDASFLLDNGKTSILYDTGFGFTGYRIAEKIKLILGERDLNYIFLTHSHYDHALGSGCISECFPNAKIVAGKYAAEVFQRDGAKRTMKELDAKFARKCGILDYEFPGNDLKVHIPVEDGDIITAGDMKFQVISLPGHTKCCVGYYCPEKALLLSNETLGVYDGEEILVPSYLVSYAETLSSIGKIEKLNIQFLLAPHYGILDKSQTEYFLANMRPAAENTARELLFGLKSGMSDDEIITRFKEKYWRGYIKEIYPEDAVNLNTQIMLKLIKTELLKN